MSETKVPTQGRIVFYQARGSADGVYKPEPMTALILTVGRWITDDILDAGLDQRTLHQHFDPTACLLKVFTTTGEHIQECVYDADGGPGTWRWPTIH